MIKNLKMIAVRWLLPKARSPQSQSRLKISPGKSGSFSIDTQLLVSNHIRFSEFGSMIAVEYILN
ncbi:hypothetical protein [Oscillatoria sp. HE19RPO]|uniref:hypothetical protein n=1 Tax=Oscillatoria sp. HE19RPO TaxID=2954806 RepID=UPI0020C43BED|nr:hypothetical protein [Oscillatoria sp. HE19RPO]